jgi:hypothetical protein
MRRGVQVTLALALLALTGGCATTSGSGTVPTPTATATAATTTTTPPAATVLVLRLESVGGFVQPSTLITRLPTLSVYSDGRAITEEPITLQAPGPALLGLVVRRLSQEDVHRLVTMSVAAGVGSDADAGQPAVADAPSTRFIVRTDQGVRVTEVNALGLGNDSTLTAAQRAVRAKLLGLSAALTDLPGTLGFNPIGPYEAYRPERIAAVASPWSEPGSATAMEWPGPDLPGPTMSTGYPLHCVVTTGDQTSKLLAVATHAHLATPWLSGGQKWMVVLRELLPDESTCADLGN